MNEKKVKYLTLVMTIVSVNGQCICDHEHLFNTVSMLARDFTDSIFTHITLISSCVASDDFMCDFLIWSGDVGYEQDLSVSYEHLDLQENITDMETSNNTLQVFLDLETPVMQYLSSRTSYELSLGVWLFIVHGLSKESFMFLNESLAYDSKVYYLAKDKTLFEIYSFLEDSVIIEKLAALFNGQRFEFINEFIWKRRGDLQGREFTIVYKDTKPFVYEVVSVLLSYFL